MKQITSMVSGDRLNPRTTADILNSLIANQNELYRLVKTLMTAPAQVSSEPGVARVGALTGTTKTLAQTQGTQDTDTYDQSSDNVPLTMQCVTDLQYDESTHKLSYRTRTLTWNGIELDVSAESALVDIATAEECE